MFNELLRAINFLSMILLAGLIMTFLLLCAVWVGLGLFGGFVLLLVAIFGR